MPQLTRFLLAPLLLVLVACGTPSATPTGTTGGGAPTTTPVAGTAVPASPTLPAGQKPPRPAPDPAAVAAGAPLRATLLAQIDEYAREVAKCNAIGTPVVSCNVTGFEAVRAKSPELAAYMGWYSFIKQCSSDGKGGYIATMMYIYSPPDELREPGLLDVYVSGTPWCGQATPPARATPTAVPVGQRPPRPSPDPAAVAAGAPLRAALLAQIEQYDRAYAACTGGTATPGPCTSQALVATTSRNPELARYVRWYDEIERCHSDGKGGYIFVATFVAIIPTPAQLRDPALLDVYVSATPWCGLTGGATTRATPSPAPSTR